MPAISGIISSPSKSILFLRPYFIPISTAANIRVTQASAIPAGGKTKTAATANAHNKPYIVVLSAGVSQSFLYLAVPFAVSKP